MQRLAFKMKLKPGCEAEYEKRHARLWPEMKLLLKEGGIGNYSIFYDPDTLSLFAYQEIGGEGSSQEMGGDAVVRKCLRPPAAGFLPRITAAPTSDTNMKTYKKLKL